MKIYDTLKDVFVGDLVAEEQQELAKFASALLDAKRKKDLPKTTKLLKEAAEQISDAWDFDRISGLCIYLANEGDMTKQAAGGAISPAKSPPSTGAALVLGGGLLAAMTAPLVMAAVKAHRQKAALDRSFNHVLTEHPVLAGTNLEATRRHFEALKTFAPDVAANSLVAGNVLHRMHRLGPAMMDINTIKELAHTQQFIQSNAEGARKKNESSGAKAIGAAVSAAAVPTFKAFSAGMFNQK